MKLYGAALTMLLVRRDHERAIGEPEGLTVSEEGQQKILQEIAYWMIRNGIVEAEQKDVIALVSRILPAMPQVAAPEDAPRVFRFLLHRSGVLRAPTAGTVDFIHRTFLDYLGARAAVEAQDINMIAAHAHEPQWEDIVWMAVGHARDTERAALLKQLVAKGDEVPESSHDIKVRIHLLAAASLEHATSLDPRVRAEVEQRAAALIPPTNSDEAEWLSYVGPLVLDLLPGPEGLSDDEATAVVTTARMIGGDHALHLLGTYAEHQAHDIRAELAHAWQSFEARAFAELVLSRTDVTDVRIFVHTAEQLAALHLVGAVPEVSFFGDLSPEEMASATGAVGAGRVDVVDNERLKNLRALGDRATLLTYLNLVACHEVDDYSGLAQLGLSQLRLHGLRFSHTLSGLDALTNLRTLTLGTTSSSSETGILALPASLPPLPSITQLRLVPRIERDTDAADSASCSRTCECCS